MTTPHTIQAQGSELELSRIRLLRVSPNLQNLDQLIIAVAHYKYVQNFQEKKLDRIYKLLPLHEHIDNTIEDIKDSSVFNILYFIDNHVSGFLRFSLHEEKSEEKNGNGNGNGESQPVKYMLVTHFVGDGDKQWMFHIAIDFMLSIAKALERNYVVSFHHKLSPIIAIYTRYCRQRKLNLSDLIEPIPDSNYNRLVIPCQ